MAPHTIALTTFDDDVVTAGPEPLTLPAQDPSAWVQQLEQFWARAEAKATRPPRARQTRDV